MLGDRCGCRLGVVITDSVSVSTKHAFQVLLEPTALRETSEEPKGLVGLSGL